MLTEEELLEHGIDSTRKANLLKLAAYLRKLDREKFHMDRFYEYYENDTNQQSISLTPDLLEFHDTEPNHCGSVACAVGCGPAAGIPVDESDADCWETYSGRVFIRTNLDINLTNQILANRTWAFLFSGSWSRFDNSPTGAAERIEFVLENGLKDIWDDSLTIYDFFASLYKNALPYKK